MPDFLTCNYLCLRNKQTIPKQLNVSNTTHSDRSQQALRDVGDDDADEEDDGLDPGVAQDEGDCEEGDSQAHGHASDDDDEVICLHRLSSKSVTGHLICMQCLDFSNLKPVFFRY